jgi:type IV pilus assembly protein PilA
VVVLNIGILSAIAIPAFLSQTGKANDSAAKTQVGTLQTTMETYADENNGSYTGAELSKLQAIEPTLKDTSTAVAKAVVVEPSGEGFTVESEAVGSKNVFKLENKKGAITRKCTTEKTGGCKTGGTW